MNIKRLLFINQNISSTLKTEINDKIIKTGNSRTAVIDISINDTFNDISGSISSLNINKPLQRIGFLYHNSCQGVLPFLLDNSINIVEETTIDVSYIARGGISGEDISYITVSETIKDDINQNINEPNYFSNELFTLIDYLKTNNSFNGVIDIITCKTTNDLVPYFSEIENTKGVSINYTSSLIGYDSSNNTEYNNLNDLSNNNTVDIVSTYFSSNPFQEAAGSGTLLLLGAGDITLTGSVNGTFYLDQDYINTNITTIRLSGTTINESKIELSGNVVLPNDIRFVLDNSSNNIFTFEGSNNLITITNYTGTNLYPGLIHLEEESSINLQNININASVAMFLDTFAGSLIQSNPSSTRKVHKSIYVNNCNNSGLNLTNSGCGGLLGLACGFSGSLFMENCHNTLTLFGSSVGGLLGQQAGMLSNSVIIKNCYNTGQISGINSGGIAGLVFCYLGTKNLLMQNCYNTGGTGVTNSGKGGLIGNKGLSYIEANNNGTYIIEDCYNTGTIESPASGGLFGYEFNLFTNSGNIIIRNCYNEGQINNTFCGGVFGNFSFFSSSSTVLIEDCYNKGNIDRADCGGLFAANCIRSSPNINITVKGCYNTGIINASQDYDGGIFGPNCIKNTSITIENCYNTGYIGPQDAGGIIGSYSCQNCDNILIKGCYNTGDFGFGGGGIIGAYSEYNKNMIIEDCYNTGNMNAGSAYGGGICGYGSFKGDSTNNYLVNRCYNTGNIYGSRNGGILGQAAGEGTNLKVSNCYNKGVIQGDRQGGIVGSYIGYKGINTIIENCYNYNLNTILNTNSGGIGSNFSCYGTANFVVNNCFSVCNVSNVNTSGILFGSDFGYGFSTNPSVGVLKNCYVVGNIEGTGGDLLGNMTAPANYSTLKIENCYTDCTRTTPYSQDIGSIVIFNGVIGDYPNLNITTRFNYSRDYNELNSNKTIHADYNLELLANGKIDSKLNYPNGAYIADTLNLTDSAGYPLLKVFRDNVTWNSDYYTYYTGIPEYGVGSLSRYFGQSPYRNKVLKLQTTNITGLFMNNLIHKKVDYENIAKQNKPERDRSSLTRLERLKYRRAYNLLRK